MKLKGIVLGIAVSALALAPTASADVSGNYIVVDDAAPGTLYSFTPAGTRTTIATGGSLTGAEGVARLAADDYLVAAKGPLNNATPDGAVVRVRNGVQSVLATGGNLINPHAIALSNDRKTAFTAGRDGRIVAITIATGAQRLVAGPGGNLADLRGIAVEQNGQLVVADTGATTHLVRVDPNSGLQTPLITGAPLADARSVMVRPNGDLIVGDQGPGAGNGAIFSVDLPAITTTSIAGGSFFAQQSVPGGIALDTRGDLIVSDRNDTTPGGGNGRLYRVSLAGAITEIIPASSGLLLEASGLAIVPPKCGGKFATIVGTPGKDNLAGTNGPDVIVALGGKDTLKGKGGKDVLCGGKGNDKLLGGGGKDRVIGGKGTDVEKP